MQWPHLSPDLLAASDLDGHHSHRDPQCGGEHFCGTGKDLGRRLTFSALAAEPAQRKGLLLPSQKTRVPAWPSLKDNGFFSLTDGSPTAHPPLPGRHDPFRNPRCDDRWLFHHCRQRDGCLHILWGESHMPHAPGCGVLTRKTCPGLAGGEETPSRCPTVPFHKQDEGRVPPCPASPWLVWPKPRTPSRQRALRWGPHCLSLHSEWCKSHPIMG